MAVDDGFWIGGAASSLIIVWFGCLLSIVYCPWCCFYGLRTLLYARKLGMFLPCLVWTMRCEKGLIRKLVHVWFVLEGGLGRRVEAVDDGFWFRGGRRAP